MNKFINYYIIISNLIRLRWARPLAKTLPWVILDNFNIILNDPTPCCGSCRSRRSGNGTFLTMCIRGDTAWFKVPRWLLALGHLYGLPKESILSLYNFLVLFIFFTSIKLTHNLIINLHCFLPFIIVETTILPIKGNIFLLFFFEKFHNYFPFLFVFKIYLLLFLGS